MLVNTSTDIYYACPQRMQTSYNHAPIPLFACSLARMVLLRDEDNDLERMKEKEGGLEGRRATVKCEHKHVNVQREYEGNIHQ